MKNKKIGLVGVISNVVLNKNTHNGGWTYVLKNIYENYFDTNIQILNENDNWNDYDILIINEGINYHPNKFNIFGGVSKEMIYRLHKYDNYHGKIYSNQELNYEKLIGKRNELKYFAFKNIKQVEILNISNIYPSKLILGDSHSVSVYKSGYSISRNDGKTLHGFLKNPEQYYNNKIVEDLVVYFGNIDIRFHLCRQTNPFKSTVELCHKYIEFCTKANATPVCLLPIEFENRKIPKSGYYKNQPFFGKRELRRELVLIFNDNLKLYIKNALTWPQKWYDNDYPFINNMEQKQSVHLNFNSYMNANQLIENNIIKEQQKLF